MPPSPLTILTAVIVVFFVVLTVARGPVDADYWWHLTTGRLILETGSVPTVDPFSFAYDGPWVAHEWLGEVIIAALIQTAGYPVTAAVFGTVTAAALLIPAYALRARGIAAPAVVPWLVIGSYSLAPYATVRPQVLSWALLALLLAHLLTLRSDHLVRPWLVVPLIALWANLHGLFVVGLGVVGIHTAFSLVGRSVLRHRKATATAVLMACLGAAVVTPAGIDGLLYPLRYLRQDDWGTEFIAEWQAMDIADPRQWGIVALMIATVILGRRIGITWRSAVGVAGLAGAVIAVRNGPIAVVASVPMLAEGLQSWLAGRDVRTTPRSHGAGRRWIDLATALTVTAAIVIIVPRVASGSESGTFPTAAFDRLAVVDPDARLLVEYDWAGYAIHRVHEDGGTVFIDGRSDMYPRRVFEDYVALHTARDAWRSLLDGYRVEAILLRPDAPLVYAASNEGWCARYEGTDATLLLRCSSA